MTNNIEAKIDGTCRNCGAKIMGKFCFSCGQSTDDHHRSIFHLIYEALEGFFHFDGRIWRTLPLLFFKPGRLNRDYIEGRINRHVPPFRMFLVSLFIFILSSEHRIETLIHHAENSHEVTQGVKISTKLDLNGEDKNEPKEIYNNKDFNLAEFMDHGNPSLIEAMKKTDINLGISQPQEEKLREGLVKSASNPKAFLISAFSWAHKLAVLLVPIMALSLASVYFYKREYYFYDHLLVSTTMMSFVFLTMSLSLLLPAPYGPALYGFLFILTPINFFFTLRGTYDSGWIGSFLKTLYICTITTISFSFLIILIMGFAAYFA